VTSATRAIHDPAAIAPSRGPLRVFVVDDEPDAVLTMVLLLRQRRYEAQGGCSGSEALNVLTKFDPHVIICDVAMPEMSGWDVATQVRQRMGDKRPMLIAISGQYTKQRHQEFARFKGFDHYLTKPCDLNALFSILEKVSGAEPPAQKGG
jgi:CheY-like chemotaxis protein